MIPAFAYLRVSGKSQIDKDGFVRQRLAIDKFAAANGYEVVGEFAERGVTGEMEGIDRPAWSDMVTQCRTSNTTVVIFERLDRLARKITVQENMLADAKRIGIATLSTAEPDLDSDDPSRVIIRQMLGVIAQYEKAQIVLKLRGARQRKKAATGRCEGRKPFGSRAGEDVTIRFIIKQRQAGVSWQAIANSLNQTTPTRTAGRKWFPSTVQKIFKRSVK